MMHCWKDRTEYLLETCGEMDEWEKATIQTPICPSTCMLEAGHDGPHEFTPDENLVIQFKAKI